MFDIEIINFYRPDDDRKNIFVSCIPTVFDEEKLHVSQVNVIVERRQLLTCYLCSSEAVKTSGL
jgi:hypothetical protein